MLLTEATTDQMTIYGRILYRGAFEAEAPRMFIVKWASNDELEKDVVSTPGRGTLGRTSVLDFERLLLAKPLGWLFRLLLKERMVVYTVYLNQDLARFESPYLTLLHELQHIRDHQLGNALEHGPEFEARLAAAVKRIMETNR